MTEIQKDQTSLFTFPQYTMYICMFHATYMYVYKYILLNAVIIIIIIRHTLHIPFNIVSLYLCMYVSVSTYYITYGGASLGNIYLNAFCIFKISNMYLHMYVHKYAILKVFTHLHPKR